MALASALVPSPDLKSAFSPYTESPSSPIPYSLAYRGLTMQRHSANSESLAPPPSPYPATVDPSPVESTNSTSTDATDIEEGTAHEDGDEEELRSPDIELLSPTSPATQPPPVVRIDTESAARSIPFADDGPQSVIHAPKGFQGFGPLSTHQEDPNSPNDQVVAEAKRSPPLARRRSTTSPSGLSENTVTSVATSTANGSAANKRASKDTAPINTSIPPSRHGAGSTPRASTAEEAEAEWQRKRNRHSKSLSDTSETEPAKETNETKTNQVESIGTAVLAINSQEQEIASLRSTLGECWNLCTSMATLSKPHRERMFSYTGSGEVQETAWGSCWKLCQKLYESRDEDHASQVRPTLALCRTFCQALFDARIRGDEVTDSILRVSFELNNHLYNTHDRNLPDIFSERTLDFYLTMCHRLMKQRTALPEETEALLRAGWTLAELLFSIRENNKDHKPNDVELLSQAVQACWDLCDLFREGWTQARPDRGTPRQTQRSFQASGYPLHSAASSSYAVSRIGVSRPPSQLSLTEQNLPFSQRVRNQFVPETPTTIFDDRDESETGSPVEPQMPNILVLGPEHPASRNSGRWPSSASQSGYSEVSTSRSNISSRTAQGQTPRAFENSQSSPKSVVSESASHEDLNLVRIKALILKAAQNKGYPRNAANPPSLPSFVKGLPDSTFGILPWQLMLFESYRKLVLSDPTLRDTSGLPMGRRLSAHEIAKAVIGIRQNEAYAWISNLYTWVFGFDPEDATVNKGGLQV